MKKYLSIIVIILCILNSLTAQVFKKVEEDGISYLVTEQEIHGTYMPRGFDESLGAYFKCLIRIGFDNVFFEIHEKGEDNKALSSIASLKEKYVVKIFTDDETYTYSGNITKNNNSIYNTIEVNDLSQIMAEGKEMLIVIHNDRIAYLLDELDTSEVSSLLYSDKYYSDAYMAFYQKEYEKALAILDEYKNTDNESYVFYEANKLKDEIKTSALKQALQLFINAEYEAALPLLSICEKTDDSEFCIRSLV